MASLTFKVTLAFVCCITIKLIFKAYYLFTWDSFVFLFLLNKLIKINKTVVCGLIAKLTISMILFLDIKLLLIIQQLALKSEHNLLIN